MFIISSQRGFLSKVLIFPLKIKKKKTSQSKNFLLVRRELYFLIFVLFGLRNLLRRFFTVWATREILKLSKRDSIIHHPNMKISSQSSHSEQHTCPWRQAWVKKQVIRKALAGGAYGGFSRICLQCRRLEFSPWVRKIPWRRECNTLQYTCLENSMDRRA